MQVYMNKKQATLIVSICRDSHCCEFSFPMHIVQCTLCTFVAKHIVHLCLVHIVYLCLVHIVYWLQITLYICCKHIVYLSLVHIVCLLQNILCICCSAHCAFVTHLHSCICPSSLYSLSLRRVLAHSQEKDLTRDDGTLRRV